MDSSVNLTDSVELEWWVGLTFKLHSSGNLKREKSCSIFPVQIDCIGRKLLFKLIPNVAVMYLLLLPVSIATDFAPFLAKIRFPTKTYFTGVWSVLRITETA